jgi:DNA repair photolyase
MKKFTGHKENWGEFLDIKINANYILQKQIKKLPIGLVSLSTVTDAYQPIEKKYSITRKCLETLLKYQFPVSILTKSSLVLRDIDIIKLFNDIEVGLTITTDNDYIAKIFEPFASPISTRINTLKILHENKINTYAFIGPILPMNPEALINKIIPYVNYVLIDKLNYKFIAERIYKQHNLTYALQDTYLESIAQQLTQLLLNKGIEVIEAYK